MAQVYLNMTPYPTPQYQLIFWQCLHCLNYNSSKKLTIEFKVVQPVEETFEQKLIVKSLKVFALI